MLSHERLAKLALGPPTALPANSGAASVVPARAGLGHPAGRTLAAAPVWGRRNKVSKTPAEWIRTAVFLARSCWSASPNLDICARMKLQAGRRAWDNAWRGLSQA